MVSSVQCRKVRDKSFARVTLCDVTGEIEGAVWNYNDHDFKILEGGYYLIKLETTLYAGKLEFKTQVDSIAAVDTPINHFDYIKGVSDNLLASYASEVEETITQIDDPIYRDVMGNAVGRLSFLQALREAPYGVTGPMAYRGGLLVHVAHSMRLALVAIKQAQELETPFSPSLVVTGCALRNIGWHTTVRFQGNHLRPKDAYNMIGIYRASARYIDHLMITSESDLDMTIPEPKRQALENMCNKRPDILTLEGQIVSCADNMADVLDFGVAVLQQKPRGNWNNELFTGHLNS